MGLAYILQNIESETGISSPTLNTAQRNALVAKINKAAREIWNKADLPGVLEEVYVCASSHKQLALPPFVGEIRAIRSTLWNDQWNLLDLRPRYNRTDWLSKWKSWRLLGHSPYKIEITNAAPGTIVYPEVDTSLTITLVGDTTLSNRSIDNVVVSATPSVPWTQSFLDISSIKKSKLTDFNVQLLDADGNELALIYADELYASYVIVDVSQYPTLIGCNDNSYPMEVLYKPKLPQFINDEDEFPVQGYDDIIINKTKQLLAEDQEGKEKRAIAFDAKTRQLMAQKENDVNGTLNMKIGFTRNGLLNRRRYLWNAVNYPWGNPYNNNGGYSNGL